MRKICLFIIFVLFNFNFFEFKGYVMETEHIIDTISSNNHKSFYNNYMEAYFDNLTKNISSNTKGSCGYVALGMILSYYDNYINDEIIDEKYDVVANGATYNFIDNRVSPGVLNYVPTTKENANYYDYIIKSQNYDFQSHLITIGYNKKYHKSSDDNYGTTITQRQNIISTYLNEKGINYSIEKFEPIVNVNERVKTYAIEWVKKGYPVLLSIKNDNGRHAVVAYDYDSSTDELFCHFGYEDVTHITPESNNYTYANAMVLKIEDSHKHSNNYAFNGKNYCYCSHEIITYKYNVHKLHYVSLDSSNHSCTCDCGYYEVDKHNFMLEKIGSKLFSVCTNCNFTISSDEFNIISEDVK